MSIFDKMKGVLFESEETQPEDQKPVSVAKQPQLVQPFSPAIPTNQPPVNYVLPNVPIDSKFAKDLEALLESNNLSGLDYYEFSKAVKSLENIPGFTEAIRYSTAFNTLQATHADEKFNKQYLLETADHYVTVLNKEKAAFDSEMTKAVNLQVTQLLEKSKEKENLINGLRQQIEAAQGEINQLNFDAQTAQTKINFSAQEFNSCILSLINKIEQDKKSISTYIN